MTLVKRLDSGVHFLTFWKSGKENFVSGGYIYGLTFEVKGKKTVEKDAGNYIYVKARKEGYIDWETFCRENDMMCLYYDFGRELF